MTAADLETLRESGILQSFCKRTTDGHATDFVRGRRLDAAGLCAVPLGADEPVGDAGDKGGLPESLLSLAGPITEGVDRPASAGRGGIPRRWLRLLGLQRLSRRPHGRHPLWAV
jgi:hypothetical protein